MGQFWEEMEGLSLRVIARLVRDNKTKVVGRGRKGKVAILAIPTDPVETTRVTITTTALAAITRVTVVVIIRVETGLAIPTGRFLAKSRPP